MANSNIVLFQASVNATQGVLQAAYDADFDPETEPNPHDFISYDEDADLYDLITVARYPHIYAVNGNASLITMVVTPAQADFIAALPSAIDTLAVCDGNPDSDYLWASPEAGNTAKFRTVAGQDFFTGSGTPGDEDYIAPRKKLAVLL